MQFRIVTWNVGFGGMGSETDFFYDGGTAYLPFLKSIKKSTHGICKTIHEWNPDVILLQEVATGSILNRWNNLFQRVRHVLNDTYTYETASQFYIPLLPESCNCNHMLLTATKKPYLTISHHLQARETYFRIFKRRDTALVTTVPLEGKTLTIIHIHLAAFDWEARVRRAQVLEIFELAQKAHANGPVIVGGDWNMAFTTHTHNRPDLPYLLPFADDLVPPGWRTVFDTVTPSLRSGDRPWRRGAVTATVDGFIVSPDIISAQVRTQNLDFKYSDHNPVELTIDL